MSAADLIARAAAAGVQLTMEGGRVRIRSARAPAPNLLAELRAHRDDVRRLLSMPADPAPTSPAPCVRDAWGLSEADKAEGMARLFSARTMPVPVAADECAPDHDAAEQAAVAAFHADEGGATAPDPSQPDELRDGLYRGFHAHRPTWDSLPYGGDRGAAFAEARVAPGACPTCAGRRWWCRASDAADAAGPLTCSICHPPVHLPAEEVREVTT